MFNVVFSYWRKSEVNKDVKWGSAIKEKKYVFADVMIINLGKTRKSECKLLKLMKHKAVD